MLIPFVSDSIFQAVLFVLIILGLGIGIFVSDIKIKRQQTAASVQQLFDIEVFQLEWDKKLFGIQPDLNSTIAEKSEKILYKERRSLTDWYPAKSASLPLNEAILCCQKENVRWDRNLRVIYRMVVFAAIIIILLFIIFINIALSESTLALLAMFTSVIAILRWLFTHLRAVSKDIERLDSLNSALTSQKFKTSDELLIIQSKIYEHRRNCTPLPEWLYNLTKSKQEKIMRKTTEVEIENRE